MAGASAAEVRCRLAFAARLATVSDSAFTADWALLTGAVDGLVASLTAAAAAAGASVAAGDVAVGADVAAASAAGATGATGATGAATTSRFFVSIVPASEVVVSVGVCLPVTSMTANSRLAKLPAIASQAPRTPVSHDGDRSCTGSDGAPF